MNDFSFSKVFRAAFNTLVKNFTDVFILSVLVSSSVLVMSLLLNSVFLTKMNDLMNAALHGNTAQSAAADPFMFFSVYIGGVVIFAALILFFLFSAFLRLCKGETLKLKNCLPSFPAIVRFLFSAVIVFVIFAIIIVFLPIIAKMLSYGEGYSAGMFVVSAVSFALIAAFVIFSLRYILYFLPLIENATLRDSLVKSYLITNNRRMKIFVLFAVIFLINFVAKYFIFLLLITIPFSVLAVIYAYLELCGLDLGVRQNAPEPEINL